MAIRTLGIAAAIAAAIVPAASAAEPQGDIINASKFGAKGDAVMAINYSAGTQMVTGTDSTAAIQAAIDYALQNNNRTVCLPDGKYKTTDTIHLGYGGKGQFSGIELVACSSGRAALTGHLAGVSIYPAKTDRPAINIQGGRQALIRGIAILGMNYAWIYKNRLKGHSYSANPSDWLDPAITPKGSNPGGLQQHSPYAAITVDAYKGPQPADHYPAVNYPVWTGIIGQYDKAATSDIIIEDMDISGFAVGIIGSPSGNDNGDFIKIRDSVLGYCIYCIAIANSQSRSVEIRNINSSAYHTLLTNAVFGNGGGGELSGPIDNVSGGAGYQSFYFSNLGLIGPIILRNHSVENQVRLGQLAGGGSFPHGVIFEGCDFDFDGKGLHNILPAALLESSVSNSIVFRNCSINASSRLTTLVHGISEVTIDGGNTASARWLSGPGGSYAYARAVNYTGGVLLGGGNAAPTYPTLLPRIRAQGLVKGTYIDPENFTWEDWPISSDVQFAGSSRAPLTQFATGFVDTLGKLWRFGRLPGAQLLVLSDTSHAPVAPAISGDVLKFEYASDLNAAYPAHDGDILYHIPTGTIFVITAIGPPDASHGNALPVTARQMNNLTIHNDGSVAANTLADKTLSGYTNLINCSIDLPRQVEFGTFAAGSKAVSNVSRGDGYGVDISTYYKVRDRFTGYAYNDPYLNWPTGTGNSIASITDGSPGSMTLSADALVSGRFPIYVLPIQ
ncbi:MAG: glycoside hydrolase family 55 protein [Beijerinckiaceae bacterium]|nr:glycoside hydrolase family 55 protein [Beijerinckiaceae bacterium]